MSARPILRCRGVGKRFDNGTLALAGMDLDVRDGEFLSLLGPSGRGKSTLLKLISGLSEPSMGEIDWPHSAYDAAGNPRPALSFVFQEPTLMPWATALANTALPAELAGMGRRQAAARAEQALATVGLAGSEGAYPRELSGGMRMRVSIARALVTQPRILLMDEPFAALDEITRFRLNNDLLRLWQAGGFTVVFVTHSVFESVFLSQRIVVMAARPGRIIADLPLDAPYPRPPSFRTSAQYAECCRTVSAALEDAMMEAA